MRIWMNKSDFDSFYQKHDPNTEEHLLGTGLEFVCPSCGAEPFYWWFSASEHYFDTEKENALQVRRGRKYAEELRCPICGEILSKEKGYCLEGLYYPGKKGPVFNNTALMGDSFNHDQYYAVNDSLRDDKRNFPLRMQDLEPMLMDQYTNTTYQEMEKIRRETDTERAQRKIADKVQLWDVPAMPDTPVDAAAISGDPNKLKAYLKAIIGLEAGMMSFQFATNFINYK